MLKLVPALAVLLLAAPAFAARTVSASDSTELPPGLIGMPLDSRSATPEDARKENEDLRNLCRQSARIREMAQSGQYKGPVPAGLPDQEACDKAERAADQHSHKPATSSSLGGEPMPAAAPVEAAAPVR